MDFLELAKERYSVRKFSEKKVEKEKIGLILNAAQLSPTACNLQPQRILVIEEKEALERLKNCTPFHFDTKIAILICYDKNASWKRKFDGANSGEIDASIVTTHMMLEITNLGLGTTWVGHFDPEKMKEAYNLPENIIPLALLPIGYPAEDCTPFKAHEERKDLSEIVSYNSF